MIRTLCGTRFNQYREEILPMIDHMQSRGTRIIKVNGERPIEDVHAEIMSELKGVI